MEFFLETQLQRYGIKYVEPPSYCEHKSSHEYLDPFFFSQVLRLILLNFIDPVAQVLRAQAIIYGVCIQTVVAVSYQGACGVWGSMLSLIPHTPTNILCTVCRVLGPFLPSLSLLVTIQYCLKTFATLTMKVCNEISTYTDLLPRSCTIVTEHWENRVASQNNRTSCLNISFHWQI